MTGRTRWRRLLRYLVDGLGMVAMSHALGLAWPDPGPGCAPCRRAADDPVLPGHPERAAGAVPPSEVELALWRDLGWRDGSARPTG
ncbi:DUF6059 family protein [Micromonospora sp. NPDC050980]|uniref:DUF6059 family protein n=1 Tax=Micromonospora sp. NPDC050980 TaxID=3155161 RepID=UPI0033C5C6E4